MSVQSTIHDKLIEALRPAHLEVINESHSHSVPRNSETHFKVVAVAEGFANSSRIQRHRQINELLAPELANGVHALSLQLYTPTEWQARGGEIPKSPPCMGGSKREIGNNEQRTTNS